MKNPLFHAKSSDLYRAYQQWCDENGETPVSQTKFGATMIERGFARARATGGATKYVGIGLRAANESEGMNSSEVISGKVSELFIHEGTLPKNHSQPFTPSLPDKPQSQGEQLYREQQAIPAGDKRDDWYRDLSAVDKEQLSEYCAALRNRQAAKGKE